jgi:nucleotide-binding universal stress UspA family protein
MLELKNILAPTDLSQHAESGLRYAVGLAERFGAALHLVHVLPEVVAPVGPEPMILPSLPAEYYDEAQAHALDALAKVLKPEWGTPKNVEEAVCWGDPVQSIITYARDHAVDLIVLATHGRTGLGHVLLGSVAERIVREAPCPVLTVRDRRND